MSTPDQVQPLDISSEEFRTYTYANGGTFTVSNPQRLYIVDGSHRVVDRAGMVHRPERGFVGISWKTKTGQPEFVA